MNLSNEGLYHGSAKQMYETARDNLFWPSLRIIRDFVLGAMPHNVVPGCAMLQRG